MLQHALSQEGELLHITDPAPGPYFCPECVEPLGKKLGPQRTWHFFHYDGENEAPRPCKKRGDCSHHEKLQLLLIEKLSLTLDHPIEMEYPIPEAKRIADLAIPAQKIAIEIQRSPLAFDQLLERTEAYWKHNWHVLWLIEASLWQKDFMPRQLQEYGQIPHYLLEEKGKQVELWDILLHERNSIQRPLHTFIFKHRNPSTTIPILEKRKGWTLHIEGDFLDTPPEIEITRPNKNHKSLLYLKLLWFKCLQ